MEFAIVYDCEYLTTQGSQSRYWCGPSDPDPIIVQIGAAKLRLSGEFDIADTLREFVTPIDRHGAPYEIDPFFTRLTAITPEIVRAEGRPLIDALTKLECFSEGAQFWSWGKDELNMMAISCYIAGVQPIIPAARFDNACKLLLKAGMPTEDLQKTRSHQLADYFEIEHPTLKGHDALDDALSVAYVLQRLLRDKKLSPADLRSAQAC